MGTITDNFSRSEFLCRCGACNVADPHPVLVCALQELCDLAADTYAERARFIITGPGRCWAWNKVQGGASGSRHLPGVDGYYLAVDGYLERRTLRQLYALAQRVPAFHRGGIGVYVDGAGPGRYRLHLDVRRDGPARWAIVDGNHEDIVDALEVADDEQRKHDRGGAAGG